MPDLENWWQQDLSLTPAGDLALQEAWRVLRPGGRFLCLEFSTVDVPGLDRLYDLFSFPPALVTQWGRAADVALTAADIAHILEEAAGPGKAEATMGQFVALMRTQQ